MLTREALTARKTRTVELEGGDIVIRALTATEGLEARGKNFSSADILKLISDSIVEPTITPEDAGMIDIATMNKIVAEVFAFNALGDKAIAEAQVELKKTKI